MPSHGRATAAAAATATTINYYYYYYCYYYNNYYYVFPISDLLVDVAVPHSIHDENNNEGNTAL